MRRIVYVGPVPRIDRVSDAHPVLREVRPYVYREATVSDCAAGEHVIALQDDGVGWDLARVGPKDSEARR